MLSEAALKGPGLEKSAWVYDTEARRSVLEMAQAIGFDAVDAGELENARWLETLGLLNIILGYKLRMGAVIGFKLVHRGTAQKTARAA